jgi:citrate synthase
VASPVIARALDVLFILHADHEQNCSTATMRVVGSSQADPYLSMAGAASALSGPLHGGANEAVLTMLDEIGSVKNIPAYIKRVKAGELKLMGFGHRVYKNYDPRARIIKAVADEVFEVTGRNTRLDIALELERIALADDYFVTRKLYPNVDFYSGIIYQAMGFQPEMFTVLFAIPRAAGWLAQWNEMIQDPEQKISRPRQLYTGVMHRKLQTTQDEKVAVKVGELIVGDVDLQDIWDGGGPPHIFWPAENYPLLSLIPTLGRRPTESGPCRIPGNPILQMWVARMAPKSLFAPLQAIENPQVTAN